MKQSEVRGIGKRGGGGASRYGKGFIGVVSDEK